MTPEQLLEQIQSHLAKNGTVLVCGYTRIIKCKGVKYHDFFRVDHVLNRVEMRHGHGSHSRWDTIRTFGVGRYRGEENDSWGCSVRFE